MRLISESVDGKKPDNFQPAPIHDVLLRLDPRIIVTTNYDSILERASSNGYRVKTYASTDVGHEVRTGAPLLLKIHGSVDAELDLVLTRSDYSRLRRTGRAALDVLEALLLTRTTLFVGFSLSDPDIQLLLENNMGREVDSGAHYMLTSSSVPNHRRRALVRSYGVELIQHQDGDYAEAARMLELLADLVESSK
ncbi:SIR2 family NAD-dependent protein deacylase [Pseudosporangium ferrugineum]